MCSDKTSNLEENRFAIVWTFICHNRESCTTEWIGLCRAFAYISLSQTIYFINTQHMIYTRSYNIIKHLKKLQTFARKHCSNEGHDW